MMRLFQVIVGFCFVFCLCVANERVDSTYFKLLEGCDWGRLNGNTQLCKGNNDAGGDSFAYYKLIKPLSLSGEFVFINTYPSECGHPDIISNFVPSKSGFNFLATAHLSVEDKHIKEIENLLPQWFLDGLLGEVRFQVSFEVENRRERILFEGENPAENKNIVPRKDLVALRYASHLCDYDESKINVAHLTLKKIAQKPSNRDAYEKLDMLALQGYELSSTDEFVNLRESPNGKILMRLYTKDKDSVLIVSLRDKRKEWWYLIDKEISYNNNAGNDKWIKVLVFPPHIQDVHKAIIGYIHTSQIKLMGFDGAEKRVGRVR